MKLFYIKCKSFNKRNWQVVNLANECKKNELKECENDESCEKTNMFKEIWDEICHDTLVQNILNLKHIVDDNIKSITIVLGEGF